MEIKRLNIENLIPGMQNVDVIGKISRITKRSFETEKAKGELASISLIDETGSIRLTLWNEEIDKISDINEGDVVHVSGYVRQGLFGPELRLGRFGKIEKSEEKISRRARISDLREGQIKEIRAALVQVFETNPFYEVCHCGVSLKEEGENFVCINHGVVEPEYALVVSGILDDGSDSIRCVLFREQAEFILGLNPEEAKNLALRKGTPEVFKSARLGEYVFEGQVRRNKFFDRLEFVVNRIRDVDIQEEIELLS